MKENIHTWCNCFQCKAWKTKKVRRLFHKTVRAKQKEELRKYWEIINSNYSIWYTD